MRYFGNGLRRRYRNVQVTEEWLDEKRRLTRWETPVGVLTDVHHYDAWNLSAHLTEYKLKGPQDFAALEFMLQDEEWYWDQAAYEQDWRRVGECGVPQFYLKFRPMATLSGCGWWESWCKNWDKGRA